jgi:hypothetical protein
MWNDSRKGTLKVDGNKWRNIGSSISITTVSYINTPNDVPLTEDLANKGAGAKLTTTVTLTGNYDKKGKFTNITYDYSKEIGATFNLPGMQGVEMPGQPNTPAGSGVWTGATNGSPLEILAHVTTPDIETNGLKLIGSNVDVNQELKFILNNGKLNFDIAHGSYPSIGMNVVGTAPYSDHIWYSYQQQSFIQSHATKFWTIAVPLKVLAPEFYQRMKERQAQAQSDHIRLNKLYQEKNRAGSVKLND